VGIVLNTSRWMTAVGDAGMMRRAVLEARAYARHREAFGRPIEEFPSIRHTLADMVATSSGALHLVFALTSLEDRIDAGTADDGDVAYHRFLVNLTKYLLSVQASEVVHSAIEVLGGNGTIEEFSVLPRLYRDALVYESWEGTHNVLVAQVLNDLRRLPILEVVTDRLHRCLDDTDDPTAAKQLRQLLDQAVEDVHRSTADPTFGAWYFRAVLDRIGALAEAAHLLEAGVGPAAHHLVARHLTPGGRPDADGMLAERVDAVLTSAG